ncbi:PREDICTED: killer cell immunoglobulin-like receptor 3DL3-like [Elephantulus edwardii]|uniref:killer cell immunoglobulin-like receptor 3DL3-like n=1 Tax=Elephantulus edwardii TaxID=28737 RepID=UPI0003F0C718|nr:PREDICTED: killer cell immunoglobulin-like receptor 3DL3-like [Elephantulus edwardii]
MHLQVRRPPGVTHVRLVIADPKQWDERIQHGAREVVEFSIRSVTRVNAGVYFCNYLKEKTWSGQSDPLELMVTGVFMDMPSLTALPGPNVTSGGHVTLLCQTVYHYDIFLLSKDERNVFIQVYSHQDHNSFLISPVKWTHGGTYRCYGTSKQHPFLWSLPSKPLDLLVTGFFTKPSIWTHPSSLVNLQRSVTVCCASEVVFEKFLLHKEGDGQYSQQAVEKLPAVKAWADFSVGPVTSAHVGTYRCYGSHNHSPYTWSHPSDPLELVLTGVHKKPSLRAHAGHVVSSGEDMTLCCHSESSFDMYHLSREGDALGSWLPAVQRHKGTCQVELGWGPPEKQKLRHVSRIDRPGVSCCS